MINLEGLTGRVIVEGSPDYNEARENYNGRFNKFPKVIVFCMETQDVVNAILWARQHPIPFRIRDGRHSYEAFSLVNGGLIIDISEMSTVQINKENQTARIGAGIRLLPLYEALWNEGVTISAGVSAGVGLSGLTLGGGYGLLSRLLGMTCDGLLEIEMVTAQGEIIHGNYDRHPDLFWACQGAGNGNFGVITSFTFHVHPMNNVARYIMTWDFQDLKEVMGYWQMWAPYVDNRLTSLLLFPSEHQGDLRSSGVFVGSEEELRQILIPLQEAPHPQSVEIYSGTWMEAVDSFAGQEKQQELFKNSSAFAYEPFSEEALDTLMHNLQTAPGWSNVVAFDAFGGSIGAIPRDATAFVHRNALFMIQYQSYWTEEEEAEENIQWIERFRSSMLPYTWGAYYNYCDCMITDWPTAYFGENLARVKRVKQMYDPENFFHYPQSIPLD